MLKHLMGNYFTFNFNEYSEIVPEILKTKFFFYNAREVWFDSL